MIGNTSKIREVLNAGKYKDYTYAILFFLVSSFFLIFVIRPVLSIAVSLQKESHELENVNKIYEDNITNVLKLQSELEKIRSRKQLIAHALPEKAGIKNLIDEIQRAAQEQGIQLEKVSVTGIFLKEASVEAASQQQTNEEDIVPIAQTVNIQVNLSGSYEQTDKFLKSLLNQQRLKNIDFFTTQNVGYSSTSGRSGLRLDLKIESYYL